MDLAFATSIMRPKDLINLKSANPLFYLLHFCARKREVSSEMPFFKVTHEHRLNTLAVKADSVRVITRLPTEGRTLRYFSLVGTHDTLKVPLTDAWLFGRGVYKVAVYRTFAVPVSSEASRHSMIEVLIDNSMSHNLIVRRVSSTLHGFGGLFVEFNGSVQLKSRYGIKDGIRHLEASSFDEIWAGKWRSPEHLTAMESSLRKKAPGALVLDGHHQYCIEMRDRVKGACEFDGKLSVVHIRGVWYLFSRANQQQEGGRYVQVAVSHTGPTGPYSKFEQLRIKGYKPGPDANMYLFTANQNPLDEGQMIGLVPVNEGAPGHLSVEGSLFNTDGASYIAATLSCDGVHWLPLTKLVSSDGFIGRTLDHPVDGLAVGTDPDSVYFYIHRDVYGISPYYATSTIVQHQFNPTFLRNLTWVARNTLQGCHSPPAHSADSSRRAAPHPPGEKSKLPKAKKPIDQKKAFKSKKASKSSKGAKSAKAKPTVAAKKPLTTKHAHSEIRKVR